MFRTLSLLRDCFCEISLGSCRRLVEKCFPTACLCMSSLATAMVQLGAFVLLLILIKIPLRFEVITVVSCSFYNSAWGFGVLFASFQALERQEKVVTVVSCPFWYFAMGLRAYPSCFEGSQGSDFSWKPMRALPRIRGFYAVEGNCFHGIWKGNFSKSSCQDNT